MYYSATNETAEKAEIQLVEGIDTKNLFNKKTALTERTQTVMQVYCDFSAL